MWLAVLRISQSICEDSAFRIFVLCGARLLCRCVVSSPANTMVFDFHSIGYLRIAAVSPEIRVADPDFNATEIINAANRAFDAGCDVALFPELGISGYTCADLFHQSVLLDGVLAALGRIVAYTAEKQISLVVGLPLVASGRLFNCAAFVSGGEVKGIVPKRHLPNYGEFYEERWFSSELERTVSEVELFGRIVPFGADLLFSASSMTDCVIGIEICEDLWSVIPPSSAMSLSGATVLLNLSASNELLGKAAYRSSLVVGQSARCLAAYVYAGAGPGESSTDVVFSGHSFIAENGTLLAETERFSFSTQMAIADVDIERLVHERIRNNTMAGARAPQPFRTLSFSLRQYPAECGNFTLHRPLAQTPFVPANEQQRSANCREVFSIQTTGLARRLRHLNARTAVLGLSGGLDSTLALLVVIKAFDKLGLDRRGIVAITMPGFGTTERTKNNAVRLAEQLGVTLRTIPIGASVRQHFLDIGHDETVHDITYENAQARERTQILMDVANQVNGIVVGTGDLSELALGWCTYNGDQMSMYGVNAGIPKTLVRYLVLWCSEAEFEGETSRILLDVYNTPVSPELLPLGANDTLEQQTENTIGPYELHDFFLYSSVRLQYAPRKIFFLAQLAFNGVYDASTILRWMTVFFRRFVTQQFKRSPMPDGPKVGSVGLSPRGDWRMPSDAHFTLWMKEIEALQQEVAHIEK